MTTPERLIVACVLRSVKGMTPRKQAIHYRALARLTSSDVAVKQLIDLADQCDALERNCEQLRLDFQRKAQP